MRQRFTDLIIRRKLIERSVENPATPLINGAHCREWLRALHNLGYGRMWAGSQLEYTHRLSHEVFIGPIPVGQGALHRCDNPKCLEPRHLWAGTKKQNSQDMVAKGRHRNGAEKRRGLPVPHLHGAAHPRAKLSEDEAREIKIVLGTIRRGTAKRRTGVASLARKYGVSPSLLYGIRDGRNWSWL